MTRHLSWLLLNLMSLLKYFIFSVSNLDIIERGNVVEETIAATVDTSNTTDSDGDSESDIATADDEDDHNHKLLKHILHNMNKFERMNIDMVKAMKENNRYLYQILKNIKQLMNRNNTNSFE